MRRPALPVLLLLVLTALACERRVEVKDPISMPEMPKLDSSNMLDLPAFEQRVRERLQQADTALVPHERLRALLPDSLVGYVREINEARTFHAPLFSFSEASKVFYNANQQYVEFTVGDYVGNADFFRVNMQRYNLAMGVEMSGMRDEKCLDGALRPAFAKEFFAWSSYNNRKDVAWFYIGLDDRVFVTIEATGQDGPFEVVKVKEWMNWQAIAP